MPATNALARPHSSPGDFKKMQEQRAEKFAEFKVLAELERQYDEGEQAKYDRLLAEVQRLDAECLAWHRIVPTKRSGRFLGD